MTGGGGSRSGGGGGVETNCEKLRKIAGKLPKIAGNHGKLRENCNTVGNPPYPSTCNSSGQVAQIFPLSHTKGPWAGVSHNRYRTSTPRSCRKLEPQMAHRGTVPSFATGTCCSTLPLHPHNQPHVPSSRDQTQQPPRTLPQGGVSQMVMPYCWWQKKGRTECGTPANGRCQTHIAAWPCGTGRNRSVILI